MGVLGKSIANDRSHRQLIAMLTKNLKTPKDLWSGKNPHYNHLRPFVCETYAHVPWRPLPKVGSELFTKGPFLGIRLEHGQSFLSATGGYRGEDHLLWIGFGQVMSSMCQ